jgi:ATP-binding cassette subfamily B protein
MSPAEGTPVGAVGPVRRTILAVRTAAQAAPLMAALSLLVALLSGTAPTAAAWLTKSVLDDLTGQRAGWDRLAVPVAGLVFVGLLTPAMLQVGRYVDAELGRRVTAFMQNRLFSAINSFEGMGRFEDPRFHDRLRLAQQGGQMAPKQLISAVFDSARALITLGGFLSALLVLSPVMAGLVLLAGLPAVYAQLMLGRRQAGSLWRSSPTARRQLFYATLQTDQVAAKEVRLFGLGDWLRGRMLTELGRVNRAARDVDRRVLRVQSALALAAAAVAGGGLVWAVGRAATGALTIGGLSVFVAAIAGTQNALGTLVGRFADSHQSLIAFGHYLDVVGADPDLTVPVRPRPAPELRHGIELRDVWFRYDDEAPWVLRGVDLFIPFGRSVALVGLNGAGKSTLVKLLCRFYDPTRGSILWDGVDIRDVPAADLRRRIGAVFQDHMNYDLSAAENIGVGDLDSLDDMPRIHSAARHAGVDATLAGLPHGYHTMLSRIFYVGEEQSPETGVILSGGQWQRLALARAMMRDRRDLLILDEPSSGLDAEAEHAVHERLRQYREGRTSLLISHRLSAVREADLIVVLADGRIEETGDHAGLMAAGRQYARLFTMQASGYQQEPAGAAAGPVR